jgi:hypothetical protein
MKAIEKWYHDDDPCGSESEIIDAVARGRLKGIELSQLIDQLDAESKLRGDERRLEPRIKWNAAYLNEITSVNTTITFSKTLLQNIEKVYRQLSIIRFLKKMFFLAFVIILLIYIIIRFLR